MAFIFYNRFLDLSEVRYLCIHVLVWKFINVVHVNLMNWQHFCHMYAQFYFVLTVIMYML